MTATLPVDQTPLQETPVEQFQARRARLAAQMQAGSIAIIPSAPEQVRNADAHFPYRACYAKLKTQSVRFGMATVWGRKQRRRLWHWMQPLRWKS